MQHPVSAIVLSSEIYRQKCVFVDERYRDNDRGADQTPERGGREQLAAMLQSNQELPGPTVPETFERRQLLLRRWNEDKRSHQPLLRQKKLRYCQGRLLVELSMRNVGRYHSE